MLGLSADLTDSGAAPYQSAKVSSTFINTELATHAHAHPCNALFIYLFYFFHF